MDLVKKEIDWFSEHKIEYVYAADANFGLFPRDEEIIELYFNRDEDAIAETDRKYGKYCQSIAGHILASSEDVEEVLDDTWVKAWNSIPPTRPKMLRIYLGKITRNLAFNIVEASRAQKRGSGVLQDVLEELMS